MIPGLFFLVLMVFMINEPIKLDIIVNDCIIENFDHLSKSENKCISNKLVEEITLLDKDNDYKICLHAPHDNEIKKIGCFMKEGE